MEHHSALFPNNRYFLLSKREFLSGIFSGRRFLLILLTFLFLFLNLKVSGQTLFTSKSSGLWNSATTWDVGSVPGPGDDAIIDNRHIVSLMNDEVIRNLTIKGEGVLNADNKEIRVNGNLYIDGIYTSKNSAAKNLQFYGGTIGGTGSIIVDFAGKDLIIYNHTAIDPSSRLTIYGNVTIRPGITVTNNAEVEITGDVKGSLASSTWINGNNSSLTVGGALLTTGILDASASGNTVAYNRLGDQMIKPPFIRYHNLDIKGSGIKTIQSALIINGNLNIYNSATFNSNNFDITIQGDWNNQSNFAEGTGLVIFSGGAIQKITCSADEFFNSLKIEKTGGEVILEANVIVKSTLTLSTPASIINSTAYRTVVGTGLSQLGTIASSGGFVKGKLEKWINGSGSYDFPVGDVNNKNITMYVNNPTTGGSIITEFIPADPGNSGLPLTDGIDIYNTFVEGYWSIDKQNGFSAGSFDLDLTGTGFSSFSFDATTRILTRPNAGSAWSTEGTHEPAAGVVAKRDGLISIPGQYALGDDNAACIKPVLSDITGLADVCTGSLGVTYSVDNHGDVYTWTINGGVIPGGVYSGTGLSSITVNWGSTGMSNAQVKVVASKTDGCTYTAPKTITVRINSFAPSKITGKNSVPEFFDGVPYSVPAVTNYEYDWDIVGGTQASGGTTNSITVDWLGVGPGSVAVRAKYSGCATWSDPVVLNVIKYDVIESVKSGDWNDPATWNCGCIPFETQSVRINADHTVRLDGPDIKIKNLIIAHNGILNSNSKDMYVHGDLTVNGTYSGDPSGTPDKELILDGTDKEISGIGYIIGGFNAISGNKTISSTAVLTISLGEINIGPSVFIKNSGIVMIQGGTGNIVGYPDGTSTWLNDIYSTLEIGGSLLSIGTLRASSTGNTITYNGGNQTIKVPFGSTYYNLKTGGTLTKALAGGIVINGNLLLTGSGTLDVTASNNPISVKGNFTNTGGTFNYRAGTVTFNGNLDQFASGNISFYDLTFSNPTGDLTILNDITVRHNLTMSGKDIITGGNILHVGTSATDAGSITYNSGIVIGLIERWAGTFGNLLFPVGRSGSYNPANIYIDVLDNPGSIICEFRTGDPGNIGLPLADGGVVIEKKQFTDGYWSFSTANSFSSSRYDINLTGNNFTSYPMNINTRIIKRPAGGAWGLDGTHVDAVPPVAYRADLTGGISDSGTDFCLAFVCAPATVTSTITQVKCSGGNDGAIDISVSGGSGPYTYLWSNGSTVEDISGVVAGPYNVTITDLKGCITFASFTIFEPDPIAINEIVTHVTCSALNSGSINISVTGGTAPYTYTWTGAGVVPGNEDQINLIAGTYHVRVTDSKLCTSEKDIVVNPSLGPPAAPTVNIISQPDCIGGLGSVEVTAPVGSYAYSKDDGVSFQASPVFINLIPNLYRIRVQRTSDLSCISSATDVTINVPTAPAAPTATVTQPTCAVPTGTIAINTPLGADLEYRLDAGSYQPTLTFTGVAPGNHTLVARSILSPTCVSASTLVVIDPAPTTPVATASSNSPVCVDGTINLTGGPAGMTYSWTGPGGFTSSAQNPTISGGTLADAGNYILTVNNGTCTSLPVTTAVVINPLPVATASSNSPICVGGTINLTGGPNGMSTYLWTGPDGFTSNLQNPSIPGASLIKAGTYSLTVNNGTCTSLAATVTVVVNALPVVTFPGALAAQCVSSTTYALSGGTPAGGTYSGPGVTGTNFNASVAGVGTHTITYSYTEVATGCTNQATNTTTVLPLPSATLSSSDADNTFCAGTNVTFTASGGTNYDFRVDGASVQNSASATYTTSALTHGQVVDVVVSDGTCSATSTSITNTVNAFLPVSVTIAADANPLCSGAAITFTASPVNEGTTPSYQWYNGAVAVGTDGPTYSYVPDDGETITVVLLSSESCASGNPATSNPITVAVHAPVTVSSVPTNILCNGASTGAIDITPAGGTAPYTFVWTGTGISAISEDQTGLAAGTYSVTVTDAASCVSAPLSVILSQPSALTGTIVTQTNVSVFGGNNGSVEVAASGGTAPYQYRIGTSAFQASGVFTTLAAGDYSITVQDANSCSISVPVTIGQPSSALAGSVTGQTNVTCFGTLTGTVTVSGSGGVSPYQYRIDGGAWQASGTFGSLGAGNHTVNVADAAASVVDVPVTILSPAESVGGTVVSQSDVLCFGGNTGSVTVAGSGGTGPYRYGVDGGSSQASATFSLSAGTHIITVVDDNLCTFDITVVIVEPTAALAGTLTSRSNISCYGAANGQVIVAGAGGTAPYQYSINGGAFQSSGTFTGLLRGSHNITVRDANNCTVIVPAAITEPDALLATESHTDVLCPDDPSGTLSLTITGGISPYNVIWADGVTGVNRTAITDGVYSAVITDQNACATSINVTVGVLGSEDCIEIPEIITPNGDGYNDTWRIRNIDMFPNAEVVVFNRWGKKVFESRNILANPWDGTLKGTLLPTDSYHYILDLKNGSKPRSGVISIIK